MNLDAQLIYEAGRIRRMEEMLAAAERKLVGLYREADRYGLKRIMDMPSVVDAAWERRVLLAKVEAAQRGEVYTLEGM